MADTRADRIYQILAKDKRLKVSDLRKKLAELEDYPDLDPAAISVTVRQDNTARRNQGKPPRFNAFNDGDEEFGYVSITKEPKAAANLKQIIGDPLAQIPLLIEKATGTLREQLRKQIASLTRQVFEANFLSTILAGPISNDCGE